jgi:hypothetical protein
VIALAVEETTEDPNYGSLTLLTGRTIWVEMSIVTPYRLNIKILLCQWFRAKGASDLIQ